MKKKFKYMYILFISLFIVLSPIKVHANSITLNKSETLLGIGYTETLKYTLGEGLDDSNIIWTSSNESVATVQNGKVLGITEGSTIITASINGKSATCKVTVSSDYITVTGISLNKTSLSLLIGTSETLKETISPSTATNTDVTWTSSDTSIASVNSSGKVTAKKVGTAIITVSSFGYKATCTVKVVDTISLKGISLNKTNLTIKENESEKLSVTYNPNNATNKKVTWKSSNTNIVTVDSSGKVTAKKPGTATITVVTNDGGYVATCKVTVQAISKAVTSISLDKKEIKIVAGQTETLKATINPSYAENKNVTWKSNDTSIASVDSSGKVTAIKPGTVEIKVTTEDGKKEAICKVTVTAPPLKSISFKETEQTMYVNTELELKPILEPSEAIIENPIWTSSDEAVATVENGVVKGLSQGKTTITISNQDKTITASIDIIVTQKTQEILNITIDGYELNFHPHIKNYTLKIGNESELKITTNADPENVTIKGNQKLKNGSIITITVTDGASETYVINIQKEQNYTIFFIAIILVLVVINIIRVSKKKKNKQAKES